MVKEDRVVVLLAAFNGARYIEQQISSIVSSCGGVPVSIVVGLDPSSDNTEEVVEGLRGDLLLLRNKEPSGGAKQNFSKLAEYAIGLDEKYFAFSDQDDVWDSDRLTLTYHRLRAMECEYGADTPLLVFSDSRVVTDDLTIIEPSFFASESLKPSAAGDFRRLVTQNVGQGCTFLFNRALLELATPVPDAARMHDHWFMLVASVFGKVDYVPKPLLSYRQHSSNVIGSKGYDIGGALHRALRKSNVIRAAIARSEAQAKAFGLRYRDQLTPELYDFFVEFGGLSEKGFWGRRWFCLKNRLRMSSFLRTIGLYIFV